MPSASRHPPTPERPIRRAVIDVGTNSVKLLVADVTGSVVSPVLERSEQTRLGRGFYETRRLQPVPISRTARTVANFAAEAANHEASSIRVIATSAAREARNPEALLAAIRKAAGFRVEIISGEQEAGCVFHGVISDPDLAGKPLLIVDAGGGSTEFILGNGQEQKYRQSFALGTVRLLEQIPVSDPPTAVEWRACRKNLMTFLRGEVSPALTPKLKLVGSTAIQMIGTSGTATIMACIQLGLPRFNRKRIEGTILSSNQIRRQRRLLWSLSLAERRKIPGLPANRADVILIGVAIYEAVMQCFRFTTLRISTRGLRFGALTH
jgi:exopolyphosphatase/guanosine-5'-triphosphate,3'-diphosphate pyrophosphatase